jgi:two-component sensor histidine kinase
MASDIASSHRGWPLHGGETGALIRARDWGATPLGEVCRWPERLRAAVDTCLDAAFASFVWWGPELIQIYNDAALPIMQARHPAAFGVPAREAWQDVWPAVGPIARQVISSGTPVLGANVPLTRPGAGAASFTFSCSALRDAASAAAGVLVTAFDGTETACAAGPPPRFPAPFETMAGYVSPAFNVIHGERREDILRRDNLANWPALIMRGGRETALTYEHPVEPPDGDGLRWVPGAGFPLADDPHRRVTAEDAAAECAAAMVAELQHRTRNLIAVVRAIIGRTLATSPSPDEFWRRIDGRLRALSRVQGLLSRSGLQPVTIDDLLRLEFDAEDLAGRGLLREQVDITGPAVRLQGATVQTLALALHELGANAREHGALSTGDGRLRIRWRLMQRGRRSWLVLDWVEETVRRDGAPSGRKGYGRAFIEHALSYSHGAETCYELDETGLWCSIALPLDAGNGEGRR